MPEIFIQIGDITKLEVDAIVNAANSYLRPGGGVDGAIRVAAGDSLNKECEEIISRIGFLEPGKAVYTLAGKLKAKYVIHTVGPIWQGGNSKEAEILKSCYTNCLDLASKLKISSIAFPSISTGVYGYPKFEATSIAFDAINTYDFSNSSVGKIILVCFDDEMYSIYKDFYDRYSQKL